MNSANNFSSVLINNLPCDNLVDLYYDIDIFMHNKKAVDQYTPIIKDKDVVIFGSGPTLNYFENKSIFNDCIKIGVNSLFNNDKYDLDFFFCGDYVQMKKYNINPKNIIQRKNNGLNILLTRKLELKRESKTNRYYIPDAIFEQLGDNAQLLYYTSKDAVALDKYHSRLLYSSYSIGQVPLLFSSYCQAKTIYLVGFDQGGALYADGSRRGRNVENTETVEATPADLKAIHGYEKVLRIIQTLGLNTKIVAINPVCMRGIFEELFTQRYVDENKINAQGLNVI